jgi:ribosomal protein S18 acetylase RimI-like enzyme
MRAAPTHQGRGHGRRIYDELERRARDRGFGELVLDTMSTLTGAQRL